MTYPSAGIIASTIPRYDVLSWISVSFLNEEIAVSL